MKKYFLLFFVIISLQLNSFECNAGPSIEKVKKKIIGTWKFLDFYNPYTPFNSPDTKFSTVPYELYKVYTFMENGKVIIWSLDKSKLDLPSQTLTWGVYTIKDRTGEEFTAVKLVESDIDPNDIQKIESSNTGIIFIVEPAVKNYMLWIKIDRLDKYWKQNWQSRFTKILDKPHE